MSATFMKFWLCHERRLDQCLQLRQFEEKFKSVSANLLIVYYLNLIYILGFMCAVCMCVFLVVGQMAGPIGTKLGTWIHLYPGSGLVRIKG